MFISSLLLIKTIIFAAVVVFLFDEARQKNGRQIFWLGFALVFFFLKEAILVYLLQRPPEPAVAPLSYHLDGLIAAALPLLRDVTFPVEIVNHYFLVWLGLEMGFAVVLQEYLTASALPGDEKKQSRQIILAVNVFFVLIFVVLAFSLMAYQYVSDMFPYYLWAFVWACAQYLLIAWRVRHAREGKGVALNFIVYHRCIFMIFAVMSIAYLGVIFLIASEFVKGIPFICAALLWHLQGAAVLFLAWCILSRTRENTTLEADGVSLQKYLAQEVKTGVVSTLSEAPFFDSITRKAREIVGAEGAALYLTEEQDERLLCAVLEGFFPPPEVLRIDDKITAESLLSRVKSNRVRFGKTFIGEAAQNAQIFEELNNLKTQSLPQTAGNLFALRSAVAFPLVAEQKAGKKVLGVLTAVNFSCRGKRYMRQKKLLALLAEECGPILQQLRRYQRVLLKKQAEREFSIAHGVQRNLMLKTLPEAEGVEFAAFSKIAKEGGGDYYDILDFGVGRFGFVCADIAGRGVAAALLVVVIRSIIRSNALPDSGAGEVVGVVNDTISAEAGEERFASLFYCQYDAKTRALNYCNAGHAPLLLYRAAHGSFAQLDTAGMPVGITKDVPYDQAYCSLYPGDIVILLTDGVLEATNAEYEQFGMARLQKVIRENIDLSARELSDKIHTVLEEFVKGVEQHDDATLLIMKVL
jgi:sigma-B regulation protein RsbU (phosphoserine phosphatase)